MKKIKLTQGKFAFIDDEDFDRVNQYKWYAHKGANTFYARRSIHVNGKIITQRLHRFILNISNKIDIDHKDHNGLNCQKSNLRIASRSQNQINRPKRKDNTSGFKGVFWHKYNKNWRAQICINHKIIHIGSFVNIEDAKQAYEKVAKHYFGEFAY